MKVDSKLKHSKRSVNRIVATLRSHIKEELPKVGVLPYAHTMVDRYLDEIRRISGSPASDKAITELNLGAYGWVTRASVLKTAEQASYS